MTNFWLSYNGTYQASSATIQQDVKDVANGLLIASVKDGKQPYEDLIDENTKTSITRLNRGEMVMIHPAFRHAIKILFPHAAVKKP